MAYMGNLKKGDRVKVTFEGEVKFGSSFGVDLKVGNGIVVIREETFPGVEFEKIEPPVEVFKPGDVVRSRADADLRALGDTGYITLRDGECYTYGDIRSGAFDRKDFTSEKFEKVNLAEVPF